MTVLTKAAISPRALIFDMDGLMVDSEPLWWSVERSLAREHGKLWTDAMAHRCIGTGLTNTVRTMRSILGIELDDEGGVRQLVERFIARIDDLALKPGCAELVEAARAAGLKVAVASSSTEQLIAAVLARFELRPRFHAVVSGETVARPKPAPDIFLRAAELLEVEAPSCVVLEDSAAGVEAARAAAMDVIAVPEREPEAFVALTPHIAADLLEARAMLGL